MKRVFTAVVATAATLGTACGPTWPNHAVSTIAYKAPTAPPIATIDVLPLDLQLWAERGYDVDLGGVSGRANASIMNTALDMLGKRNYGIGAIIDGNGDSPGGNVLAREDLVATLDALGRYGAAASDHPGQLPVPFLPAHLGDATGADATLYIGGWGYVAQPRASTGEKVAEGVMIGLLVVAVVAIVAVALAGAGSKGGHSHGSGGHSGGGHSSGGAGGGGRVVWHGPRGGGSGGGTHFGGGGHHFGGGGGGGGGGHGASDMRLVDATADVLDAFGRTAVDISLSSPDWADDPKLPRGGESSQMYMEMTLVDNRTGLAIWHAHQRFPARAESPGDAARVARTLLASLPAQH